MKNEVVVSLGSNLGDRGEIMLQAQDGLLKLPESSDFVFSSIYQTAPLCCDSNSPDYLNAVVLFKTNLDPHKLLELLQDIENTMGRKRSYQNAPRTLDLDVILFGEQIISDPRLTVPHPRMQERFFVLTPLCEIAPHIRHPIFNKSMRTLKDDLGEESGCRLHSQFNSESHCKFSKVGHVIQG